MKNFKLHPKKKVANFPYWRDDFNNFLHILNCFFEITIMKRPQVTENKDKNRFYSLPNSWLICGIIMVKSQHFYADNYMNFTTNGGLK